MTYEDQPNLRWPSLLLKGLAVPLLLASVCVCQPTTSCNDIEKADLIRGIAELSSVVNGTTLGWSPTSCHCSGWQGVYCDRTTQRIERITLTSRGLSGSLPCQWTNLRSLKHINLGGNAIAGKLPACWSALGSLQELLLANNSLTGPLTPPWGALTSLSQLGLHQNAGVGTNQNLTDAANNPNALDIVSVSGGTIPSKWCGLTKSETDTQGQLFLLYVRRRPQLDSCMEQMCLDRSPGRYPIGWLEGFHALSAVREASQVNNSLSVRLTEAVAKQITEEGWILGSGTARDPCLDVQAVQYVVLAFALFGAALAAVVAVGIAAVGFIPAVSPLLAGDSGIMERLPSWVVQLWSLRLFLATVVDIATDINTISILWPQPTAFLLMAALFVADMLAGMRFYSCYRSKQPSGASCVPTVAAWVLFPVLLSVAVHVQSLLLPVALLAGWQSFAVAAGCLDVLKCCNLRSLYMALIEAPASIAFTTWGYLAPRKHQVGMYINRRNYFLTVVAAMAHILFEAGYVVYHVLKYCNGQYKEMVQKCGGDSSAAGQQWSDVAYSHAWDGVKGFWVEECDVVAAPVQQSPREGVV